MNSLGFFTFSQDETLICTMTGHRSVVSTLAVCDEVLYSGSWDGTVRLWSLNDHSPLTVLGEDPPADMKSILAITVDRHLLVAAHENGCIKVSYFSIILSLLKINNEFCSPLEMKYGLDRDNQLLPLLCNISFIICLFRSGETMCS